MAEKVEITKAVVSIDAVMVDGKGMTVAIFDQIEEGNPGVLLRPEVTVLGRVRRRKQCACGKSHEEWVLFWWDGLFRAGGGCNPEIPNNPCRGRKEDPYYHNTDAAPCRECHEHTLVVERLFSKVRDAFRATPQVYIAVGR